MNCRYKLMPGLLALVIIIASAACDFTWCQDEAAQSPAAVEVDYGPATDQLRQIIADELQRGILTGVSVALVDGQRTVFCDGFGLADRERQIPASAETVYRVGSISKLFTAIAAMQLVEQGKLDLDAPLSKCLPGFRIVVPFENATPITLRQLMCHRSGIVRESPVGGYLDDSQPSIAQSIASLESCVLVNPPNTKTRYSNIGVTIVGQAVAAASGAPFQDYALKHLLEPLGMMQTGWRVDNRVKNQLATGYMRVADGQGSFFHRAAPPFELGTIPAGNLYSSAMDMTRFAMMLLAGGTTPAGRIIQSETLAHMSAPQLTESKTGFGLGFFVGSHGKYRTMQHTGAVYGFSTSIVVLPEPQMAVIVLANEDIIPGPVKSISDAALGLMLQAKTGAAILQPPATAAMEITDLSPLVGRFESAVHWAETMLFGDQLVANVAGQPMILRPTGPLTYEAEGRFVHRGKFEFKRNERGEVTGLRTLDQDFAQVSGDEPAIPAAWQAYLGSYGPEFIPLVISARHGHLYAMTENMIDYRLTPVNQTVFKMPEGLYADEHLVFELDETGRVHAATLANMTLPRRP